MDTRRLSLSEAAEFLGISPHTLRLWCRTRRLPSYKLGRRVVLDETDLRAFLAANRVEARAERFR